MPRVRFHDRRHTHATWRIAAGHPISAGSERLGHAKVSITLDTYAHIVAKPHDRAAEVVSALLFGPSENPDKAAVVSIAAGAETETTPSGIRQWRLPPALLPVRTGLTPPRAGVS